MHAEALLYEPLDRCIDELLLTGTWNHPAIHEGNEELSSLMEIAVSLIETARRTPPPDETKKRTLWRQITTASARWGGAGSPRFASLFGFAGTGSTEPCRTLLRGGCRPLREVVP